MVDVGSFDEVSSQQDDLELRRPRSESHPAVLKSVSLYTYWQEGKSTYLADAAAELIPESWPMSWPIQSTSNANANSSYKTVRQTLFLTSLGIQHSALLSPSTYTAMAVMAATILADRIGVRTTNAHNVRRQQWTNIDSRRNFQHTLPQDHNTCYQRKELELEVFTKSLFAGATGAAVLAYNKYPGSEAKKSSINCCC